MSIVGIPTPSPTAILMISLVERPDEDEEDDLLLPPAPLPVPLPLPLLLLDGELADAVGVAVTPPLLVTDGELDDAVCVAVTLPLLVTDCEIDATDCVAVGPESATCPTTIVEVMVGVPGSIFPESSSWLQVSNIAAISPSKRAMQLSPKLKISETSSAVPHDVSLYPMTLTLPFLQGTDLCERDPRPGVTMHSDIGMEAPACSVLGVWH